MLRTRKTRGYNENNDEEEDGGRKYDVREKIRSERFDEECDYLQEMSGNEITLKKIQRHGFSKPTLVKEPEGLGLRVPQKSFLVRDVRDCVGEDRIIDVMDVRTQKNIEMTMKDWCKYYESKRRDRKLNVISLEFSHTKLDKMVEAPNVVRSLDWVDQVWPRFLKESQTESTNKIDNMKYPKVQKYCLMSVKGSYTDFHIDFGGTSVWYHILRGKKIFWMVPPTDLNLTTFEEWTLSGMQQEVFFGDLVEECFRVELCQGNTFFIPSGWIHAVYTLEDSLVFGGNFLHSFGIENQLKVSKVEDATKVPVKFRYPFYTEIQWYVIQHYVHCLTGKDHLHPVVKPTLNSSGTPEKCATPVKVKAALANNLANKKSIKRRSVVAKKGDDDDEDDDDDDDEDDDENNGDDEEREDEQDDEKTETGSETEESDTSKVKRKSNSRAPAARKGRRATPRRKQKVARRTTRAQARSSNKRRESSDDDNAETDKDSDSIESDNTEIDSDAEKEDSVKKPTTCRMTKNSLLRLQYEVDQPSKELTQVGSSKQQSSGNKKATKATSAESRAKGHQKVDEKQKQQSLDEPESNCDTKATLELDKFIYSQDSKRLNGWSSASQQGGNQNSWSSSVEPATTESNKVSITKYELNGLKLLVKHLSKLSGAKKNLPTLIRNSRSLLDDCRKMLAEHENDDPELAITGQPISLELLSPKKSEINQLIEQFFKPSESSGVPVANDDMQTRAIKSPTSKSDSSSMVHQRNKFLGVSSISSLDNEEKKNSLSSSATDQISLSRKDAKNSSSPSKRASNSGPSALASSSAATSSTMQNAAASVSSTSQPTRPKSPPTRPLSNNQYTSKTKKDNSLILPGSFADLIAATSTEKKVFDVNAADVTSTLFGTKDLHRSPNKNAVSTSPQKVNTTSDPFELLDTESPTIVEARGTTSEETSIDRPKDTQKPSRTNSPEPPKMSPPKRFINPSFKPQNKEKLIFASAPYVSPITVSSQSRPASYYPWQSPAPQPQQQQQPQHQQQHQHQHQHQSNQHRPLIHPPSPQKATTSQVSAAKSHSSSSNQTVQASDTSCHVTTSTIDVNRKSAERRIEESGTTEFRNPPQDRTSTLKPKDTDRGQNDATHVKNETAVVEHKEACNIAGTSPQCASISRDASSGQALQADTRPPGVTAMHTEKAAEGSSQPQSKSDPPNQLQQPNKPTKPRGPPKKSKEARQVIISSPPRPIVTNTQRYLITPNVGLPLVAGPSSTSVVAVSKAASDKADTATKTTKKDEPKTKKMRKQKDKATPEMSIPQPINTSLHATTNKPPMICGLVTTPISSQADPNVQAKPAQQYLISRPVMFNTLPGLSAAHLQQIPRASIPFIPTAMPSPLGLTATQPGARLVWATQPRPPMSTSISPGMVACATNVAASKAQSHPRTPSSSKSSARPNTSMNSGQPDNTALLSLATTALSTASMPTTPTLSYLGARPPTGQAIMVSSATGQPALLTGQPFFSPIIPRLPLGGQFPTTAAFSATLPNAALTARPTMLPTAGTRPTGQLVFARLPNQNQPRYLITQPYIQPRFQTPSTASGQPSQTLAFAPFRPACPENSTKSGMKAKKVKTR